MAEVQTTVLSGKRGVTRSKKLSTRVDLTPMVDLGFLLITFFIFTTTLSEQTAMKLKLPIDDEKSPSTTAASKTLSILLCKDNRVKYYAGDNPALMQETNYSPSGLRSIILRQEQEIASRFGNRSEAIILIKPTEDCTYENIVNTLDEMTINDVQSYILMDVNKEELSFTKQ
jgi:biopolymer transport protein ExbD